jgi:hypothetical protein
MRALRSSERAGESENGGDKGQGGGGGIPNVPAVFYAFYSVDSKLRR